MEVSRIEISLKGFMKFQEVSVETCKMIFPECLSFSLMRKILKPDELTVFTFSLGTRACRKLRVAPLTYGFSLYSRLWFLTLHYFITLLASIKNCRGFNPARSKSSAHSLSIRFRVFVHTLFLRGFATHSTVIVVSTSPVSSIT